MAGGGGTSNGDFQVISVPSASRVPLYEEKLVPIILISVACC